MCQAAREGGQRCAGHAREEYQAALGAYQQAQDALRAARDTANASDDPVAARKALSAERAACREAAQVVYDKEIALASTPGGREDMNQALMQAEQTGDSVEVERLRDVLARGQALRERNAAVRTAVRAVDSPANTTSNPTPARPQNLTADGTVMDRAALGEVRRKAAYTAATSAALTRAQPQSYRDKISRDSARLEATAANDARRRAQAAYDSTPEGQARLRSAESAARRARNPHEAASLAARQTLAQQYADSAAAAMPSGRPTEQIAAERASLRADVDRARDAYEANPTPANKEAYDDVAGHYRQVDQEYLRSLPRPVPGTDYTRKSLWAMSDGGSTCDRTTAWRSLELAARDEDNTLVRSGRMTNTEFYSRAAKRAQARQAALDEEAVLNGTPQQFDPVDKKFAAAEARRRAARSTVSR